jgi:hypothetical protein
VTVDFNVPGAAATQAESINSSDETAGFWNDNTGAAHGFIRMAGGAITTFEVPGGASTFPSSISAHGATTGSYRDTNVPPNYHGFLRTP